MNEREREVWKCFISRSSSSAWCKNCVSRSLRQRNKLSFCSIGVIGFGERRWVCVSLISALVGPCSNVGDLKDNLPGKWCQCICVMHRRHPRLTTHDFYSPIMPFDWFCICLLKVLTSDNLSWSAWAHSTAIYTLHHHLYMSVLQVCVNVAWKNQESTTKLN